MSEKLYDSLEDESDDGKMSTDSSGLHQIESVKRVSAFESTNRNSLFRFGKNIHKQRINLCKNTKAPVSVNASHKNNFLPVINNRNSMPELQGLFNYSTDNEALAKKGLLLNHDGSFTKSPRSDMEGLPFVTREYKNLVFQKQKTYCFKNKTPVVKTLKMRQCIDETAECNLGCRKLKNDKKHFDGLNKLGCVQYRNENLVANDNLTDSMKRVLLQNKKNLKNRHQSLDKIDARRNPKCSFSETQTMENKRTNNAHPKDIKLHKQLQQFVLNNEKQRLTYLERQQLRNGYNPLFLRRGVKKFTSDTTRSNFGDSETGKLSEVSSLILSKEGIADWEDEEKFYEELIEKDKNKFKVQRSDLTRRSFEAPKHGNLIRSGFIRELVKLRGSDRSGYKKVQKSLCIDIKPESDDKAHSPQKSAHYCSAQSSPKLSKLELALKGKTYGYLVNARNISKFKSRADVNCGRENPSAKPEEVITDILASYPTLCPNESTKSSSTRLCLERYVKNELKKNSLKPPKNDNNFKDQKKISLPNVCSSELAYGYMNLENLTRIRSCLYCPNGRNKDPFAVH